jgi:hypothetical protein
MRTRKMEYKFIINTKIFGSKTSKITAQDSILDYQPNNCFTIQSQSSSEGIPYANDFFIRTRVCLVKLAENETNVMINTRVHFTNPPVGIIKGIVMLIEDIIKDVIIFNFKVYWKKLVTKI